MAAGYETLFVGDIGMTAAEAVPDLEGLMELAGIRPTAGELRAEPGRVRTPRHLFVAFSFNGDVAAWRKVVTLLARVRGGLLAHIEDGELVFEGGGKRFRFVW